MKKLMTIALGAALVAGAVSQAKATALETSGEFRARGWSLSSYGTANDGKATEFWDQRLRLFLTWPVAENVKVQVRADVLSGMWGDNLYGTTNTAAVPDNPATADVNEYVAPKSVIGPVANNRDQIKFDWVNLVFTWPGTPLTFTIGRQDVTWGTGMAAAQDNRDRFKVGAKFADYLTLSLMYDKYTEIGFYHDGPDDVSDRRAYTGALSGAAAGFKYGILGSYTVDDTVADYANAALTGMQSSNLLIDAFVTGKAGIVEIKAEGAFVTGKNDYINNASTDVDLSGLGFYGGVFAPVGPVKLGLEGAFASGDDPATKEENEGAFKFDYHSSFWSIILYNNFDYAGLAPGATDKAGDFSVANALATKFSASWATPVKGLSLTCAALWAQMNQAALDAAGAEMSKDLGIEIDAVVAYAVTDNVSVVGGFGYLLAGAYYDDKRAAESAGADEEMSNPYGAMLAFSVKF